MKRSILKRAAAMGTAAFLVFTGIFSGDPGTVTARAEEASEVKDLITWDFSSNVDGWYYDSGWESGYNGGASSAISWDEEKQMMKVDLDYSADADNSWSQTAVSVWNDAGMNFSRANQISFDFYYDTANRTTGGFTVKAYSDGAKIDKYQSVNEESAETVDGTLQKVSMTMTIDEVSADAVQGFSLALIGVSTDYKGSIWLDNVKISQVTKNTIVDVDQLSFDFSDGTTQGFEYAGWEYNYTTPEGAGVSAENGMLKISGVQFDPQYDWANFAVTLWSNDGIAVSKASKIVMDVYYPADNTSWTGSMKLGIYAKDTSGTEVIDAFGDLTGAALDETTGMMKATVTVPFDTLTASVQQLAVKVIGVNCNYAGDLYLDNIRVVASVDTADTSVDSTVAVNAGNAVSVSGGAITTAKADGTSETTALSTEVNMVDKDATAAARAVYAYLEAVGTSDSVIYGHQNDIWHKAGSASLSNSDTKDVTGTISGVVGIDTLSLTGDEYSADRYNSEIVANDATVSAIDTTNQCEEKANVQAAAAITNMAISEGAIITLSAHMPNFSIVKENASYNAATDPTYAKYDFSGYTPNTLSGDVMNEILPGGLYNEQYNAFLDMIADYASQVNGAILFRPFHENTGSWFWWGAAFCNAEQYKNVYRYTVEYLRDTKDVHNIIYVYGPGSEAESVADYETRYPGDEYVDMVGFDMYDSDPLTDEAGYAFIQSFINELKIVDQFATEHGKLIAVTETGLACSTPDAGQSQTVLHETGNNQKDWYNKMLTAVSENSNASYMLLWSNFGKDDGYYTPYVDSVNTDGSLHGHEMLDNFISFYNDSRTIFAKDQQAALGTVDGNAISANAAATGITGYITAPVAGRRILEPVTLTARVNGVTSEEVSFVLIGEETSVTIVANVENGVVNAEMTASDLEKMGECADGKIELRAGNKVLQTISVIYNIEAPEEDPYEIDGFENYYGVDSLLTKNWATNKASGSGITLSLITDEEKVYDGDYAMQFTYRETSDGWAGATISKEVDWSDCNALQLYTIPDGKNQKVVVQITANNTVYEAYLNLYEDYAADTDKTPLLVTIPFTEFCQRDTAGNPKGGLTQDCTSVTSFGLWVNAIGDSDAIDENGMVEGTIIYDKITAVKTDVTEATFKPATDTDDNGSGNGGNTDDGNSGNTGDNNTGGGESTGSGSDNAGTGSSNSGDNSEQSGSSNVTGNVTTSTKWNCTEITYQLADGTFMRKISTALAEVTGTAVALPAGTELKVETLISGTTFDTASQAIKDRLPENGLFKVFDISLRNSSGTYLHQMSDYVTVTMDVPSGFLTDANETLAVYRLETDGTLTKCTAIVANGKVSFTTNHFSTYILAEESTVSNPQTSDNTSATLWLSTLLLLCGIAMLGVTARKKYHI